MLTIHVESSAGDELITVFEEMCQFATKNNACAEQHVNGIIVLAFPGTRGCDLYVRYEAAKALRQKVVS